MVRWCFWRSWGGMKRKNTALDVRLIFAYAAKHIWLQRLSLQFL